MRRKRLIRRGVTSRLGAVGIASLLGLAVLMGGCGGEQATDSPTDGTVAPVDEQTGAKTTAASAEESAASIGEPVTVGDAQWTVTDAKHLDELVSRLGVEEGTFVITDVTFVNNSNQDVALAAPSLSLVDNEGSEFGVDIDANFTHLDPEKNMFIEQVGPGVTKEGQVIFGVDPDASGFELRAGDTTNFLSDEHGFVDLGF